MTAVAYSDAWSREAARLHACGAGWDMVAHALRRALHGAWVWSRVMAAEDRRSES